MTGPDPQGIAARTASLLDAADACHDRDPHRAARLLQSLAYDHLDPGQRPRVGFLLTHVFAEHLDQPERAWCLQQALLAACGAEAPLPVLRHAAAAARLAADAVGEQALTARMARAAGVEPARAAELVALAATVFGLARLGADSAGQAALAALAPLAAPCWQPAGQLDAAAAALTNNLASTLAERPLPDQQAPSLRQAMDLSACLAQAFWRRAGQWLQHARAHGLRAQVGNTLGEPALAAEQTQAGLLLLAHHDRGGQQQVDEAWLRSELAHALAHLGRPAEASVQRGLADALAEQFDDAERVAWYRGRLARQAALDAAMTAPLSP